VIVSYLFHGLGKITLATSFPGRCLYSKRDWLLGSSVSVDANARNTTFHSQTLDFQTTQNLFKNGKTNGTRNVLLPGMRNKKHLTKWKLSHLFSEVSIATLPNHEICWNVPAYVAHSIKDIKQRQHLTFRAFQSATRSLNSLLAQWWQNVFEEKERTSGSRQWRQRSRCLTPFAPKSTWKFSPLACSYFLLKVQVRRNCRNIKIC